MLPFAVEISKRLPDTEGRVMLPVLAVKTAGPEALTAAVELRAVMEVPRSVALPALMTPFTSVAPLLVRSTTLLLGVTAVIATGPAVAAVVAPPPENTAVGALVTLLWLPGRALASDRSVPEADRPAAQRSTVSPTST